MSQFWRVNKNGPQWLMDARERIIGYFDNRGVFFQIPQQIMPDPEAITDPDNQTIGGGGGGAGDVVGAAASVDGEIVLFSGITGKLIKRLTGSGFLQIAAGVASIISGATLKGQLGLTKADVNLANADNTSDATKIVSGPQQAALDLKMDKAGGTFGGDVTLAGPGTAALHPVTLQQFQDGMQGIRPKPNARLATTAALPTCTYNNGSSGVGATLTASANGALSIDATAVNVGDYAVIKNEASQLRNGLYVVTQTGSAGAPFILTRAPEMDIATEVVQVSVLVTGGATLGGAIYYTSITGGFVMGTTALQWVLSSSTLASTDALSEGSSNLYFTVGRVLGSALTGLSTATNAAITAADTVLSAFGKLQRQITDAIASIAAKAPLVPTVENVPTGAPYTIVAADAGKVKRIVDTNPQTIIFPTGLGHPFGVQFEWLAGAGTPTFDAAAGVNINGLGDGVNFNGSKGAGAITFFTTAANAADAVGSIGDLSVNDLDDASADAKTLLVAANFAAMRAALSVLGTTDAGAFTNKVYQIATVLATDDTHQGYTLAGNNAGATIAQWDAVYLGASFQWLLADANGSGTFPAIGLAVAAGTSGNPLTVLKRGTARNDAWNWSPGSIWLDVTAGALTQTPPATTGDKVQYMGFATSADSMFVDPSPNYSTHA